MNCRNDREVMIHVIKTENRFQNILLETSIAVHEKCKTSLNSCLLLVNLITPFTYILSY